MEHGGRPLAATQPIEDVRPNLSHPHQPAKRPTGAGRLEMGGIADGRHDRAVQGAGRDVLSASPGRRLQSRLTAAGEAELAIGADALVHHRTDGFWEIRVAYPVQDDLGHRPLTSRRLPPRLEIDGLGQAVKVRRRVGDPLEAERLGRDRGYAETIPQSDRQVWRTRVHAGRS